MAIDNIARGIASKALHTASKAGSGDMLASDYDSNNAVKSAGGVAEFVHNHVSAVKNLIINLTEDTQTQNYTADKTYDQIKSAYENGREVLVNIGKAVLPLMSAEFNGTSGSIIFGYTKVQADGSYVFTRAINYYHTDAEDVWSDADNTCEPLLLVGQDPIELPVATPTQNIHATTKEYVDTGLAGKLSIVSAASGVLKAYVQNGEKADVCVVSNSGQGNSIVRYDAMGRVISSATPNHDTHLTNKKYVDSAINAATSDVITSAGGIISGDLQISGGLNVAKEITALEPTQTNSVTTKDYVDTQIGNAVADVIRKQSIAVAPNSSVEVQLSNGVYLFSVADNSHGGLVHVAVYPDGTDINGLVNLNGWKCERISGSNGVKLTNIASINMDIYISSIGEGTYR